MSIRIIVPNTNAPFTKSAVKRSKAMVEEQLTAPGGGSINSRSGQTLAIAVDYCEAHNICYTITAAPGMGYFFNIQRNKDGTPMLSNDFLAMAPRKAGG